MSHVSTEKPPERSGGPPHSRTLALQPLVNRLVRGLLRTPLLCRAIGKRLLTLDVVGRKSGRHYTIPVAYTHHRGDLLVGTSFAWGRNLRSGDTVDIRLRGELRPADVRVITDEAGLVEHYAVIASDNHNFARFNQIGLHANGTPDPADLHRVWSEGARAILLTPH